MRHATVEFGTPEQVAVAHADELTIRYARRSASRVVGLLSLGGLAWVLGATYLLGIATPAMPDPGAARHAFVIATTVIPYLSLLAILSALIFLVFLVVSFPTAEQASRPRTRGGGGDGHARRSGHDGDHHRHGPGHVVLVRTPVVLLLAALIAMAFADSLRTTRRLRD